MRSKTERDLGEVTRRLDRAMAAMLSSNAPVESFTAAIAGLETEKRRLQAELTALSEPINVVTVHPQAVARYLSLVEELGAVIRSGASEELTASVRELIERATVFRTEPGEPLNIVVHGRLAALIGAPVFPEGSMSGVKLVAGEGNATTSKLKKNP